MYSAGGTRVGHQLTVLQSSQVVSLAFVSGTFTQSGTLPVVTLDTWQLIGFATFLSTDKEATEGTVFVGTSWYQFYLQNAASSMDISTASVMRIGDTTNSISGEISLVRIVTPGGGIIRTSKPF